MRHIGTKPLETERLALRRFRMADAGDIFANWAADPEVTRFWGWEPHPDITMTQSLLKQWIRQYEDAAYYHWAIVCKANSQAIGYKMCIRDRDLWKETFPCPISQVNLPP